MRSGEGGIERLAGKDGLQGGQQRLALLAQGREVAAQAGERLGAGIAAEAARHLLLDLEPTQVALGLVVIEGNCEIVEEGQHLVLAEHEPLQVAMDNGAKRALIPVENKRSFLEVAGDVVERVDPIFYGEPLAAALKALGAE